MKKEKQKREFPELTLSPGTVRATLVGKGKLYVENHDGLLEVSDSRIRVRTRFGELLITGMHLVMDTDGAGMICINGQIAALSISGGNQDA